MRLTRRIRVDFGAAEADPVISALEDLTDLPGARVGERLQAAIVKLSGGDLVRFDHALEDARRDWRDVLVAAGFEHEDWPARLDDFLGPVEASV